MPDSRFTHANGINIHYLDWRGGGAVIVCLHGLQSEAHTWNEVAAALSPEYRVLALDLRGHGDTEKPQTGYSTADFAADLEAFARNLGLERFVLMGHSLGSRIAALYAGLYCHRLSHLILEDPAFPLPSIPEGSPNPIIEQENRRPGSFATLEDAIDFLGSELDMLSGQPYRAGWDRKALQKEAEEKIRRRADGAWEWKYSHRAVLEIAEDIARRGHSTIMEQAKNIIVPTLVVRGANSAVCTPEGAQEIQCAIPNARIVTVPEVGHSIHGTVPAQFVAAIREFLAAS